LRGVLQGSDRCGLKYAFRAAAPARQTATRANRRDVPYRSYGSGSAAMLSAAARTGFLPGPLTPITSTSNQTSVAHEVTSPGPPCCHLHSTQHWPSTSPPVHRTLPAKPASPLHLGPPSGAVASEHPGGVQLPERMHRVRDAPLHLAASQVQTWEMWVEHRPPHTHTHGREQWTRTRGGAMGGRGQLDALGLAGEAGANRKTKSIHCGSSGGDLDAWEI
jgi:hypothetical protein